MTDTPTLTDVTPVKANTPAKVTPKQAIQQQLRAYDKVITSLLPAHITMERFVATVANACRKNPDLFKCSPDSVLAAALRAAQLGLEPNDERNLCFILPYGQTAQFQLGYGGVLELARRATPGLHFTGEKVCANDRFHDKRGSHPELVHEIADGERGETVAWYVVAHFPDGFAQWVVLDREAVEYHRSFSKQANGPLWSKSYDAAALKSCVHELKRWLPSSPEMALASSSDEQSLTIDAVMADDPFTAEPAELEVS